MKITRVFPRRTRATPDDERCYVGLPPLWLEDPGDEVHVSCAFTWDLGRCRELVKAWQWRFPQCHILLGGPALRDPGGDFIPGKYLRHGYTITSRGCPNRCERCLVPSREGGLRLLPIRVGWNVLDNNLLACPDDHFADVLTMLRRQPRPARFTGGLEATRLTRSRAIEILGIKPEMMFFAYDKPVDLPHLREAFSLIRDLTGWKPGMMRHRVSCYILIGYEGDVVAEAERRIGWVIDQGVRAYPMYFRDEQYCRRPPEWHDLVGGVMSFGGRK